jgi:hypothetical protein
MQAIKDYGEPEYYKPLYEDPTVYDKDNEAMRIVVESVELLGQLCAMLRLTPIACNELILDILKQDYRRGIKYLSTASITHRITETMLRYDVPGLKRVDFERVVELHKNEDAFNEWRREFGRMLDTAQKEQPVDEQQFEIDFKHAADEQLAPRVKDLEKATSSSTLEKIFVPASLSIGAGAVAFYTAGLAVFPPTALAAATLAPAGWAIDKVIRRFNKSGRKAAILREFYGYLLDKSP